MLKITWRDNGRLLLVRFDDTDSNGKFEIAQPITTGYQCQHCGGYKVFKTSDIWAVCIDKDKKKRVTHSPCGGKITGDDLRDRFYAGVIQIIREIENRLKPSN